MATLLATAPHLAEAGLTPVEQAEFEPAGSHVRLWAATAATAGVSAADCLAGEGRLRAPAVLEIARQMIAHLAVLERFDLVHGDLAPAGIMLSADGTVQLPHPGVRAIVRPEEGYGRVELPPEAYDALAPERVTDGSPPTPQSELFACGCVWWHLLAGRPPLSGGDSLSKLKSVQSPRVIDICRLAPIRPPPWLRPCIAA